MEPKRISRATFVAAHMAVIVFHVAVAAAVLWVAWTARAALPRRAALVLAWAGGLLLAVSLAAIAPIVKRYEGGIEVDE